MTGSLEARESDDCSFWKARDFWNNKVCVCTVVLASKADVSVLILSLREVTSKMY